MAKIPGIHSKKNFFINTDETNQQGQIVGPIRQTGLDFTLPYKKGSKGVQVIAIKNFLGMGVNSGDFFDEATKARLKDFQESNMRTILEISG